MSTLANTVLANASTPCFLPSTGGTVDGNVDVKGSITQSNVGIVMRMDISSNPIVIGPPFAPGGTATLVAIVFEPTGAAPHASVALRLNFYDAAGALIGVQDIS